MIRVELLDPGSPSRAPPPGQPVEERVVRPLPTRPQGQAVSPQRRSQSSQRSRPAAYSYYEPEFSVSVGSTAYDVTTLLPLRGARILSPDAAEPPPTSVSSAASPRSPGVGSSSATSQQAQTLQEPSSERQEPSSVGSESVTTASRTKRRREEKESVSSEGSDLAHPPKSKKISIACNPCRGEYHIVE